MGGDFDPASIDSSRVHQISVVFTNFPSRPFLGTGPHNVPYVFHMHEIHNTYLGVLAEEGLFGLISLLAFLAATFRCGWLALKHLNNSMHYLTILSVLIGFAGLLVYGGAMFGLRQRVLWFMCGLIIALPRVIFVERTRIERAKRLQQDVAGAQTSPVDRDRNYV